MKIHNDNQNWILKEYKGEKVNIVIKPATESEPTPEEINLFAENNYIFKRKKEYPDIGDQLDAIWKELIPTPGSEAETIKNKINAIKIKHPK